MDDTLFYRAGHKITAAIDYVGNLVLFSLEVCRTLLHALRYSRWIIAQEIIAQMYHLGVRSYILVAVVSFAVGMILAMQGLTVLKLFGAANFIATSVAFAFVRVMGPLLAGIMSASRMGAGIAAELGAMRVTKQIDALTVSAIDPMEYLVLPRVLACMLLLPLMAVFSDIIGIMGGMLIGVVREGMTPAYYFTMTIKYLTLLDVLPGFYKTAIFGIIIGTVACFHGYNTTQGTFGVGQSTKIAVVSSILWIIISDVIFTNFIIFLFPR